jgi:hypothetical protein
MKKPYQLKLDFGEGATCHKAYEIFLKAYDKEDTPEEWAIFVECWKTVETLQALEESIGATKQ